MKHVARILLLVALLAGYWLALRHQPARAQSRLTTGEALARTCVAEAGWDVGTGDCAAIVYLLKRKAERRGISVLHMAELYSSRHFDQQRTDRRRWIVGLRVEAHRPAGWPEGLAWHGDYRRSWLATLGHVHAVLRGEVPDPCHGQAEHWGMRLHSSIDWRRAQRAGWRLLDCGPTRNAFWATGRGEPS